MRSAHPADLDAIVALEEGGFPPRERWSRASWASEIEADNRIVLVVGEVTGVVTGVVSIQHVGDIAELNRLIVTPGARGNGLGRDLLGAGIAAARGVGCEEMLLEVRHDNAPAVALYDAFGLVEIARRTSYYGDGVDAVIMRLGLETDDD